MLKKSHGVNLTATTADIKIDGILDEPDWHSSNSIQNLTQSEPHAGQQPLYKTTVTVLANHHALFFGIECQDSKRPVTFSKQRDADLSDQDHIKKVIDPFLDGRSGYIFSVNASGARYDALVQPGGETENALVTWNPVPLLTIELNSEFDEAKLQAGDFNRKLFGTRVRFNFSPDIQLSSFVQYDSESNTRFRWTFHPQGDLFVIYNHNLLDIHDHWVKQSNELQFKLQYTFRK